MELKPQRAVRIHSTRKGCNRTSMELKLITYQSNTIYIIRCNRTSMELKLLSDNLADFRTV